MEMPTRNVVTYTAMLSAYAQNGQLKKARQVFDDMPERTVASWNAMITAYTKSNFGMNDGFQLFLQMPQRNAVSYATMITGFVSSGKFDEAENLYCTTPVDVRDPVFSNVLIKGFMKTGKLVKATQVFDRMVEKDVVSWSSMVDGYSKHGRVDEARVLFDQMQERNEVTWSAMINGYMKIGSFEEGFRMFFQMRREIGIKLDVHVVTTIFEACGQYDRHKEAYQLHGLVLQLGFDFDVFMGNSMITMYSRFGFIDAAKTVFDTMIGRDIISWNSLIDGYIQAKNIEKAYEFFEKAPEKDVVSWTTMITGYAENGLTKNCINLFNIMPEKDDVAWTALISGFANNGEHEEALCWFISMLQSAAKPNPLTLTCMLNAAAAMATLDQGLQIHAQIIKRDIESDLAIQNSLISMYSKCGSIDVACGVFNSIGVPNIVSFNCMITGFSQNGFGQEALELFELAKSKGHEPTEITFLGVLSACTHAGLVERGWKYFRSMKPVYKIEPGPDHYACMVDLLGKAGLLDEATKLINSMSFQPHSGIWGALLSASRTYLHVDLARLAAERIIELEPDSAAPYVVLSDIYYLAGQKTDEEEVRMTKKTKAIRKSPGSSWITLKNTVNLFLSGDQSNKRFGEIKTVLWSLLDETKHIYWIGSGFSTV